MTRVVVLVVAAVFTITSTVHADIARGDTGPQVAQVQQRLADYGYSVAVDGRFGPQTERAVRHWQKANRLEPDGRVGPVTAGSLGIRGDQIALTEPPAAPTTAVGAGLTGCDEMQAFRIAAGLPERFDGLGYRESRCNNNAISRTGCCVSWWQLHEIVFRDHRMIARMAACDATWATIRGNTAEAKRRAACAAKALHDVMGYQPWKATL